VTASSRTLLLCLILGLAALFTGCAGSEHSGCLACHRGIEPASSSHPECVQCHGGDPQASDKTDAHETMYGRVNPSDPAHWERTCGECHEYQLRRVRSSLMVTNAGMLKNIQKTWEGDPSDLHAVNATQGFAADGSPLRLDSVAGLDSLGGELYRKFCSRCHVRRNESRKFRASHASGCAACHFPYNANATYQGEDPTVRGEWPYSEDHELEPVPGNRVCLRCHNRSGRVSLSYTGFNDGNSALVPTSNARPGPRMISGGRSMVRIRGDAHFRAGMDCVDCHTSRDIMGDGYIYENMYEQVEIRCRDCHGNGTARPEWERIDRENSQPVRESRNYPRQVRPGMKMVLTGKGRKYSNVFQQNGTVWVLGKRSGELHESPVITGTKEHTIQGHERLECYTCHSRTVPQCYGCHTTYDRSEFGRDYIKDKTTRGKFSETEDYRRLYPFPLAVNQRGRISTVTPGCQTFVSVIDKEGDLVLNDYVAEFEGRHQLRFAPFYSHNTGEDPIGCRECHSNPAFFGFGRTVARNGTLRPTLLCENSPGKPLDGFLTMRNGTVRSFAAITRERSRPLNTSEIKDILAVNQCLICHDDPQDPIYQKKLDHSVLDDCLDRGDPDPYNDSGSGGQASR
jgi:hypothetical protein